MQDILEVKHTDLGARLGYIYSRRGRINIPAFVPVIHPFRQEVPIDFIKELGFELIITNAYLAYKHYREARDIHDIINFDKTIMTDSGGYQVLEYGDIDADPLTIARFEVNIKSDIAIPLDKPTGYGLSRDKAEEYVKQTLKAAEDTLKIASNDIIWVGTIQGSQYLDLIKYSSSYLDALGYPMLALGSPTEVMKAYDFKSLARMIIAAKQAISINKPLHLFGAGHPLTIALAVALGCDTFDSASYILYAKDDRYMLPNGIINIKDLAYLPCSCKVCSSYNAKELLSLDKDARIVAIAKHNLYVLRQEVENVKQAIVDGRLWEYLIQKCHSHPRLFEAMMLLKDVKYLYDGTAMHKDKAIFLIDAIDQYRPEVVRFRDMVSKVRYDARLLILLPEQDEHPFYASKLYAKIKSIANYALLAYYSPFLGIVSEELSDLYPSAHHVYAKVRYNADDFPSFKESLARFVNDNRFDDIIILADDFIEQVVKELRIRCKVVKSYDELIAMLNKQKKLLK